MLPNNETEFNILFSSSITRTFITTSTEKADKHCQFQSIQIIYASVQTVSLKGFPLVSVLPFTVTLNYEKRYCVIAKRKAEQKTLRCTLNSATNSSQ